MNKLINTFKLLSDESRLRILILLYQEELCVCEISGILNVPQPRISQHLSKLRDMNIVQDERKEKFVYYSLIKENKILTELLKNIVDDIDSYPRLLADRMGLQDKELYLSQCSSKCNTGGR